MVSKVGSSMIATKRSPALIVDDNSMIRLMTTKILEMFGFEVSTAKDGSEVVKMYEAGEGNFDLIVTDMEMPVMDGIQATKELRAMGVECKIIGASACDDETLRQSFLEAGLDHLFYKPLTAAKLESCLLDKSE